MSYSFKSKDEPATDIFFLNEDNKVCHASVIMEGAGGSKNAGFIRMLYASKKNIDIDKMKELLKEIGLVKGQVYQRSALELLKKNLKQAYNARGKYNARIGSTVTQLTENRVAINVSISEGRVSRIKDIKIIGNHDYSTPELLSYMSLKSSNFMTYFTKKDQYSKAEMDASLESLHSFYLDHGYLKFKIISSQVLLAPDRKDVYISIHLSEGPQYRFSGYEIKGTPII